MNTSEISPSLEPQATTSTGQQVRAELENLLERDLVGPWDGPEEELRAGTKPSDRYLLGVLDPLRLRASLLAESTQREPNEPAMDAPEMLEPEDATELLEPGELATGGEEEVPERAPAVSLGERAIAASSIGLVCTVAMEVQELYVTASWGRYERHESTTQVTATGNAQRVWHRVRAGGTIMVPLLPANTTRQSSAGQVTMKSSGLEDSRIIDGTQDGVILRWKVREHGERQLVELAIVNEQSWARELPDQYRLFQVELTVTSPTNEAIFLGHNDPDLPSEHDETDSELRHLALLHRSERLYATGRHCAVDADVRQGERRAWRLRTTCFPSAEVPAVDAGESTEAEGLVTDMKILGDPTCDGQKMYQALIPLVTNYRLWLDRQEERIVQDPEIRHFEEVAVSAVDRARDIASRLLRAIELLRDDEMALDAFRFANQAMALQRLRSELVKRRIQDSTLAVSEVFQELDVPSNRSWRPFQLAFVLLCLAGLTDPLHPDAKRGPLGDSEAQLLFFPTGGGKTEAYLGLVAYTIAIRRLQGTVGTGTEARDGSDGVAVLMRYTLRLLTAQQFQRATTLICACELLRRSHLAQGDARFGETPVRVGLWVGSAVTPNTFEEACDQRERMTSDAEGQSGGLVQFGHCPWCGAPIQGSRDTEVDRLSRRFYSFCGDPDGRCEFGRRSEEGLPILVVDEEIYRLTPALIIGTVDKFAQLPWKAATASLFGNVYSRCERHGYRFPDQDWCGDGGHRRRNAQPGVQPVEVMRLRPPDLIIQDELHLISDALGSMVGLYETLIDRLCTRNVKGQVIRPMLVASTATVRRAREQVQQVFARELAIFPPPVLDAGDTFFSRRVPPSTNRPGRRYRGIMAPGERLTAIEIRIMTALLEYGQYLFDRHGDAADPYMTVVDYFSSTRELAGMRRLCEDDVSDRLTRQDAVVRRSRPSLAELTSRIRSDRITQSLADLERSFDVRNDTTDARQAWGKRQRESNDDDKAAAQAGESRPLDILLATSMLQVGVDVQRLGVMIVTGQPKNMAEYIQASSRVGRSARGPGLVLTLYQWSRPRDLAYFEQFSYEHLTFGRRVEGLTTTPFSDRALDRGLTAITVGAIRHQDRSSLPNLGAQSVALDQTSVGPLVESFRDRAEYSTASQTVGSTVRDQTQSRLEKWDRRRQQLLSGQLGYQAERGAAMSGLLRSPDQIPWDEWSAPMSLRDVEPEILLQLRKDDSSWESAPPWVYRQQHSEDSATDADEATQA
ncbi:DISARM system helicase DrmA [Ferrimicrobium sp.]|uniref:DISARM system helicase DrmA n=1 Tax=Ferrimicrobium sp. TaxID=2926050 RepID=UPI00260208DA|nr:DISARM system helicase DrmA [Ferrimicrobium sp.]